MENHEYAVTIENRKCCDFSLVERGIRYVFKLFAQYTDLSKVKKDQQSRMTAGLIFCCVIV